MSSAQLSDWFPIADAMGLALALDIKKGEIQAYGSVPCAYGMGHKRLPLKNTVKACHQDKDEVWLLLHVVADLWALLCRDLQRDELLCFVLDAGMEPLTPKRVEKIHHRPMAEALPAVFEQTVAVYRCQRVTKSVQEWKKARKSDFDPEIIAPDVPQTTLPLLRSRTK